MASRGRPVGSKGTKAKQFGEALRLAINGAEGDQAELRKIAEKLVEKAVAGDMRAIKEVADRLDGKPHQSTDIEHSGDGELKALMKEIGEANNLIVPIPE